MNIHLVKREEPSLNSMQIAAAHKPKTIGELKIMLAAMEAAWDDQDDLYLGKFNDQGLYLETPQGIANADIIYWGGFGFVAVANSI